MSDKENDKLGKAFRQKFEDWETSPPAWAELAPKVARRAWYARRRLFLLLLVLSGLGTYWFVNQADKSKPIAQKEASTKQIDTEKKGSLSTQKIAKEDDKVNNATKNTTTDGINEKNTIQNTTTNGINEKNTIQNTTTNGVNIENDIKNTSTNGVNIKKAIQDTLTDGVAVKNVIQDILTDGVAVKNVIQDILTNGVAVKNAILDTLTNGVAVKKAIQDTLTNGVGIKKAISDRLTDGVGKNASIDNTTPTFVSSQTENETRFTLDSTKTLSLTLSKFEFKPPILNLILPDSTQSNQAKNNRKPLWLQAYFAPTFTYKNAMPNRADKQYVFDFERNTGFSTQNAGFMIGLRLERNLWKNWSVLGSIALQSASFRTDYSYRPAVPLGYLLDTLRNDKNTLTPILPITVVNQSIHLQAIELAIGVGYTIQQGKLSHTLRAGVGYQRVLKLKAESADSKSAPRFNPNNLSLSLGYQLEYAISPKHTIFMSPQVQTQVFSLFPASGLYGLKLYQVSLQVGLRWRLR